MELRERCRRVKLLLMDCDGVLTDGRLYFGPDGESLKVFFVRDGFALNLWHQAGYRSGIISGRKSDIVSLRAKQLGIQFVRQDFDQKIAALEEIIHESGTPAEEMAFIGDDTLDISVMRRVGLAVAVADAHEAVKQAAHYVTKIDGGRGAVRELIDLMLDSKED